MSRLCSTDIRLEEPDIVEIYQISRLSTWIQEYRDTGVQGYWHTGIQGYRDKGIQGYRDTGIQG